METENIREETISFLAEHFSEGSRINNFSMLKHIPKLTAEEKNEVMTALPTNKKAKKVVFDLNGDSTSEPDGFSGIFFQSYWDIVGDKIADMAKAFF